MLPKGMEISEPLIAVAPQPNPISLSNINYAALIYHALSHLPVTLQIQQCNIAERIGEPPEVQLIIKILDSKMKKPYNVIDSDDVDCSS